MRFMNDFDISEAVARHTRDSFPNRLAAALVLDHLRDWADYHSDGWAYWPKPARAGAKLMELADTWHADEDATDDELRAAVRPVKAFLTRQKVSVEDREVILRAAEEVL